VPPCFATLPPALLAAAVACPVFRFAVFAQMRLTCMVAQTHPSTSQFPLGVRKFASLAPRTFAESLLCMRNGYERHRLRVAQRRSCPHRLVHALWQTTQSSIKDLRFYSPLVSWGILALSLVFVGLSTAYVLLFTVYLKDAVVYHWLVWILSMLSAWIVVVEPVLLLWTQVLWCSIVATIVQRWGYGSHALAATTKKYNSVVSEVDTVVIAELRTVASVRIQNWWKGMLDMYKHLSEQTSAAVKIQTVRKGKSQKKKYMKERKWCMRVDVIDGVDLEDAFGGEEMSPFIRLKCESGNPTVNDTKAAWNAGTSAAFNEAIFVDIKDSHAMLVEAWCKGLTSEEFLGRGSFKFDPLKAKEEQWEDSGSHDLKISLVKTGSKSSGGHVNIRVTFLDPLKDECGMEGQDDWMLPKNKMKFVLNKMGTGLKVGKMLGSMPSQVDSGAASAPGALPGEVVDEVASQGSHSQAAPEGDGSGLASEQRSNRSTTPQGDMYTADNSLLQASTAGVAYRNSKDLEDYFSPPESLLWGASVRAVDVGEGWLQVGTGPMVRYLPMVLKGVPVLKQVLPESPKTPQGPPTWAPPKGVAAKPKSAAMGRQADPKQSGVPPPRIAGDASSVLAASRAHRRGRGFGRWPGGLDQAASCF